MNYFLFLCGLILGFLLVFLTVDAQAGSSAKQTRLLLRVAIIDSGFNIKNSYSASVPLCKNGHYDFNRSKNGIAKDMDGHGTAMASILANTVRSSNWCLLVFNINLIIGYSPSHIAKAIRLAVKRGAKVISISMEGNRYDTAEYRSILYAKKRGVQIFAAAGNNNSNLNKKCNSYPACYKISNLKAVGALNNCGDKSIYSNYGERLIWRPGKALGWKGTSVATAIAAGDYVRYLLNRSK